MKKDDLRNLILRLKKENFSEETLQKILNEEEVLLNELTDIEDSKFKCAVNIEVCNFYENVEDKLKNIKTLKNLDKYEDYIMTFFTNEEMVKAGIIDEAIEIINESKEKHNMFYAYYVLTNKDAIEAGIALEGAKIVNETIDKYNAECVGKVLTNKAAIEAEIALEGAKLINESTSFYKPKYVRDVLTNETAIEAGIALEGAKLIDESKVNTQYITDVLTNKAAIEAGIALEGAKMIGKPFRTISLVDFTDKEVSIFNAIFMIDILTNKAAIEARIALEGAKIVNESKEYYNAKYASKALTNEELIKEEIALGSARIINEIEEEHIVKCVYVTLKNINRLKKDELDEIISYIKTLNPYQTGIINSNFYKKIIKLNYIRNISESASIVYDEYDRVLNELDKNESKDINVRSFARKIGKKQYKNK